MPGIPRSLAIGPGSDRIPVVPGRPINAPSSTFTFVIKDGIKSLSITEVRTLCCAVPPYQENITWYFSFGGQMLSATLLRWQGEGAERDLDLLRDLVLSIRFIQAKGAK